jgi:hypothetical protein
VIGAVSARDVGLTKPMEPIALAPFTESDRRRLAAPAFRQATRWVRFAEIPAQSFYPAIRREGSKVIQQVTTVLGRPPLDTIEVIHALANRMPEPYAANWQHSLTDPQEVGDEAEDKLLTFAEDELTRRGWRRVHPVVEGLLISPDGARADLQPLVRRAVADEAARSELAAVLRA